MDNSLPSAASTGHRVWVIPDGYIPQLPPDSTPGPTGYLSHECLCVLNTNSQDALLRLEIYFEDREPVVVEPVVVRARRSKHLYLDQLQIAGQTAIPCGCPYSLLVRSSAPVVVQMSRLDTTQPNMAFLSSMGFPLDA